MDGAACAVPVLEVKCGSGNAVSIQARQDEPKPEAPDLSAATLRSGRTRNRRGRRRCRKLIERVHRFRGVHEGRPATHVDGNSERFHYLFPLRPQPDKRLGVEPDAAVTMTSHPDRERDQFLVHLGQCARFESTPCHGVETGHGIRGALPQLEDTAIDLRGDIGVRLINRKPQRIITRAC